MRGRRPPVATVVAIAGVLTFAVLRVPLPAELPQAVFKSYLTGAGSRPAAVAFGGDYLWFTDPDANQIGRLDLWDGSVARFDVPTPDSGLGGISTTTFRGFLEVWFTESRANKIGRLLADGTIEELDVPTAGSEPWSIAASYWNDEVWFTERAGNKLARIEAGGTITEFPIPAAESRPTGLVRDFGPVGLDIVFTAPGRNALGIRSATSGQFREIPIPTPDSDPYEIAFDSEGTIWFTEPAADKIGRYRDGGVIEEIAVAPGGAPTGIATAYGLAGAWFTEPGANRVGIVRADGRITEYRMLQDGSEPFGIVTTSGFYSFVAASGRSQILRVGTDVAVIAGFGPAGTWDSRLDAANREDVASGAFVGRYPDPPGVCPSVGCFGIGGFELDASGTASFRAEDGSVFGDFSTAFVRSPEFELTPSLHTRHWNLARPSQGART